jgi:hypothetical protein
MRQIRYDATVSGRPSDVYTRTGRDRASGARSVLWVHPQICNRDGGKWSGFLRASLAPHFRPSRVSTATVPTINAQRADPPWAFEVSTSERHDLHAKCTGTRMASWQ